MYQYEDDRRKNVNSEAEADVNRTEGQAPIGAIFLFRKVFLVDIVLVNDDQIVRGGRVVGSVANQRPVAVQAEALQADALGSVEILQKFQNVFATKFGPENDEVKGSISQTVFSLKYS